MASLEIRMMKLVSGEIVIGKWDPDKDELQDAAQLQNVPTQQGMQMLVTPYGFPFENKFNVAIAGKFVLHKFTDTPKELQDKYIEVTTNLTVANGLGKLRFGPGAAGQQGGGSGLIH